MVSTRSLLTFLTTCTLTLQGLTDAATCGADNYAEVAAAVQTLHINCASWTAYLASGGVWHCDSTCQQSVGNLVDTLPNCEYGGPYGQNYKQVVEGMVETCNSQLSGSGVSTTDAPTSTPTNSTPSTNDTAADTTTDANSDASASAGVVNDDTPTSDVSTTSGARSPFSSIVTPLTAMVLLVAGALVHCEG